MSALLVKFFQRDERETKTAALLMEKKKLKTIEILLTRFFGNCVFPPTTHYTLCNVYYTAPESATGNGGTSVVGISLTTAAGITTSIGPLKSFHGNPAVKVVYHGGSRLVRLGLEKSEKNVIVSVIPVMEGQEVGKPLGDDENKNDHQDGKRDNQGEVREVAIRSAPTEPMPNSAPSLREFPPAIPLVVGNLVKFLPKIVWRIEKAVVVEHENTKALSLEKGKEKLDQKQKLSEMEVKQRSIERSAPLPSTSPIAPVVLVTGDDVDDVTPPPPLWKVSLLDWIDDSAIAYLTVVVLVAMFIITH